MKFIINKEEYLSVKAAWKQTPNHTATDHIFYNALRGHNLKRGFNPIQAERKLSNGMIQWNSYKNERFNARWELRDSVKARRYNTPEFISMRAAEQKERISLLSKRYGVTFTQELIIKLQEIFN